MIIFGQVCNKFIHVPRKSMFDWLKYESQMSFVDETLARGKRTAGRSAVAASGKASVAQKTPMTIMPHAHLEA